MLWVAGATPIAVALATLGSAAGWRVSVFDPIADPGAFPDAERVTTDANLAALDPGTGPYVVVASQGTWDEEAVADALSREAAYVGLVASPTRAAAVRGYLRDEAGVSLERLAALRAPAGLDLGAETAEEIAVSILAELVQVRRGRAPFVAAPGPAALRGQQAQAMRIEPVMDDIVLLDPVCHMAVERAHARHLAEQAGTVYAFCSVGCRTRFIKNPTAYLPASVSSAQ